MIVTAPSHEQSNKSGPRPINLNRDIPQVLKLLEQVFGNSLDAGDRQMLSQSAQASQGPSFLWRLNPAASKLAMGFVWEENDRIIGNVTVLSTKTPGRYLVVNVAVHPDYRRRGIARILMAQVGNMVKAREGHQILLQVVKDNTPAIALYQSLNYRVIGSMTTWQTSISRLRPIEPAPENSFAPHIRELRRNEWPKAYALDQASLEPDLNWPDVLPRDFYKVNFWGQIANLINGRRSETWVTENERKELIGLVNIFSEWGRTHEVIVRVHPGWRGHLERPLYAKMVGRLRSMPRRSVRIIHLDEDLIANKLLREANFTARRTLTHMRLDL